MFSTMKRRLGVFTAIAVMAALVPALSASTASAAPLTTAANGADPATYEACPASAGIPSAGMTDTTSTDVDCIAYYGITTGVTATTYEPSASVPRWQMALYLTRTADKTGHTLGSGADQGFTDISGYSAAIQTAINQLKQLGVTTGTTATTYSPDDNVTREQMSMFLDRLLAKTAAGPGGVATLGTNPLNVDRAAADLYNYTDIDTGSVTFEGHGSIEELYNLRVYGHDKTVTTFNPSGDMTRADMATWLTNALAHTNLRPAGVVAQLSAYSGFGNTAPTLSVTYRDSSHNPVSGQVIDVFQWPNSTAAGNTSPWSADGTCSANTNVSAIGNSLNRCTIDVGDPSTNASGNVPAFAVTIRNVYTDSIYAWTGASAAKYDNDTDTSSTVNGTSTAQATTLLLSCDVAAGATEADNGAVLDAVNVKHGTTVTITAKMTASESGGAYTAVAQPLNRLTVSHATYSPNSATVITSLTSTTLYTDANGEATYSFTQADPNVDATSVNDDNDDVLHTVSIIDYAAHDAAAISGAQTEVVAAAADGYPCWSDDPTDDGTPIPMAFDFQDDVSTAASTVTQTLSSNSIFYKAGSATAPVAKSATVTVTDKYGSAVGNATGTAIFSQGGAEDVMVADAALQTAAGSETASSIPTGAAVNVTMPAGTPFCFTAITGADTLTIGGVAPTVGTTYYVESVVAGAGGANMGIKVATTATGAAEAITGASTTGLKLVIGHPVYGCAVRSYGPAGTASVAWNDSATTGKNDTYGVFNNAGTLGVAQKTNYRYIAGSSTTAFATGQTPASWVEDAFSSAATDAQAVPLYADTVNNSMIVQLYGGAYANLAAAVTAGAYVNVQYTYDSNDHFYLNSALGATSTGTSEAGFEGSMVEGSSTPGLLNHMADGTAHGGTPAFAAGDLDAVTYSAVPGNISIFKLGA